MPLDIRREMEAQARILSDAVRELPNLYRNVQGEAVSDAYRDIVETSPVRTGAYQNEHVIEEASGTILYESPGRVGPDAIVNPPTFIDPPTVQGRVESSSDFATVQIANRRFYAAALEYGSSTTAPRHIYEGAAVRALQNTERIVESVNRRETK